MHFSTHLKSAIETLDMKLSISTHGDFAKIGLAIVLCAATLVGVGSTPIGKSLVAQMGISESLAQTTEAAGRVVSNGTNAVQAFLGRSPGERGSVDVLKGKAKAKFAGNDKPGGKPKPTQRALGKVFDDPLVSLAGPLSAPPAVEFLPLDAGPSVAALPTVALPGPVGSGVFSPGFGGGGFIGGGGGSGGDGVLPPPAAQPAPPPVVAAIPEPSTWILLLMGFAAVGSSLRRKKTGPFSKPKRAGNCVPA